jgi:hypothetical protein
VLIIAGGGPETRLVGDRAVCSHFGLGACNGRGSASPGHAAFLRKGRCFWRSPPAAIAPVLQPGAEISQLQKVVRRPPIGRMRSRSARRSSKLPFWPKGQVQ